MNTLILTGKVVGHVKVINHTTAGAELRIAFGQPKGVGFITATIWGPEAERVGANVVKGDRVRVEGELRMVEWDQQVAADKTIRRSELKMLAHQVDVLPAAEPYSRDAA